MNILSIYIFWHKLDEYSIVTIFQSSTQAADSQEGESVEGATTTPPPTEETSGSDSESKKTESETGEEKKTEESKDKNKTADEKVCRPLCDTIQLNA